jgi:hypothetical protein
VSRPAVQLDISRADLERQNAAVGQTCVPTVTLKGKSYRLRERAAASSDMPRQRHRPQALS